MSQKPEGPPCWLEADHLVGRSARAVLRLSEGYVSGQHATLRWSGEAWELRDLASRNGTFLDGTLVPAHRPLALRRGAKLGFGSREQLWELIDDSPPRALATPLATAAPTLTAVDELLAIPSADQPEVTIFRGQDGLWRIERPESTVALVHHQLFEVGGRWYRFACPDGVSRTSTAEAPRQTGRAIGQVQLHFSVSADEEHVDLRAVLGDESVPLGSRRHNYLLLLLARERLAELARGIPDAESGWVYQDVLLRWLGEPPDWLTMAVFRIRRQFAALSLLDAANIVQRRSDTKQLRIGTSLAIISNS